jgi:hypothetical protein
MFVSFTHRFPSCFELSICIFMFLITLSLGSGSLYNIC